MSLCTNKIAVFNNLYALIVANQGTNKTASVIFFFSNIFEKSAFNCFHAKYTFKNHRIIAIKKNDSLLEKTWVRFCSASYQKCMCKVQSRQFQPFPYWSSSSVHQVEEAFPSEIPLNMKTAVKFLLKSICQKIILKSKYLNSTQFFPFLISFFR